MGEFFSTIGFFALIAGIVMMVSAKKKQKPKKKAWIVLGTGFAVFLLGGALLPPTEETEEVKVDSAIAEEKEKEKVDSEASKKEAEEKKLKAEEEKLKAQEDKKIKEQLNFTGKLSTKVSGDKVSLEITSNVPDGAIFEVMIMDGNINMLSEVLPIKDGKITHDFTIPSDWGIGYIAATAQFRFNSDADKQPDHITKIYGETGEKMTGELTVENHLNGKNATLSTDTIAYPNEKAVKEKVDAAFNDAIAEMITLGNGVIIDITPRSGDTWDLANVIVSDTWYYTPEHEKERFAETVGGVVEELIVNSGKTSGSTMVYFVDSFGKDVATPKVFGGWKIKE